MATSFKRSHAHTAILSAPALQQATADPHLCQRLLDTHGQVWVSLFCSHCSFILGPDVHKVHFVPSKSLFSQSCVSSSSSMVGLTVTSSKRAYAIPKSAAPWASASVSVHCWPIPPQEMLKHNSVSVSGVSGSWCAQGLFEPFEYLWWVWGLILNVISPHLRSCWGFSFALGQGYLLTAAPVPCSHRSSTAQPITSWQIDGKQWKQWQTLFSWVPKSLQMVTAAMKLKDACSLEEKL